MPSQSKIQFILRLLIWLIRSGQWKNALMLVLWLIQAKGRWDEAMARADGSYYEKQVKDAVEEYKRKYHTGEDDFQTNIPGFKKWLGRE